MVALVAGQDGQPRVEREAGGEGRVGGPAGEQQVLRDAAGRGIAGQHGRFGHHVHQRQALFQPLAADPGGDRRAR